MNQQRANTLIVTSLAVSGTLVVVRDAKAGTLPPVRLLVGLTFSGVALAVLAQLEPDLAGSLALLVLTSSVFVYGGPALTAIAGATKPTTPGRNTP